MSKKQIKLPIVKKIINKGFLINFTTTILIISLLNISIPAAPRIIWSSGTEIGQDIRYAFLTNNWISKIAGWITSSGPKNNYRDISNVSKIEISPNSANLNVGERIDFIAVPYDSEENTITGLPVVWKSTKSGSENERTDFQNESFIATEPGTYIITAEIGSQKTEVNVKVEDSKNIDAAINEASLVEQVYQVNSLNNQSVQTSLHQNNEEIKSSKTKAKTNAELDVNAPQENALPSDPGTGYWNYSNWSSFDDTGNQTGNTPGSTANNGATGNNYQMSVPVLSLTGRRGLNLQLTLNYNSRLWNKSGNQLTFDIDNGNPAPGWSIGFGKVVYSGAQSGCVYEDNNGVRHSYSGRVYGYEYPGAPGFPSGTVAGFSGFTTDSSYIDYNCNVSKHNNMLSGSATAKLPNGTKIIYGAYNNYQMFPTLITDVQGNYITITYRNIAGAPGGQIDTIKDTLGRIIHFNYDSSNRLISISAPQLISGDHEVIRLHYRAVTLNTANLFSSSITPIVRSTNLNVIDAIYYPGDNTGYWFGDFSTSSDSYSAYGVIAKVSQRRNMTFTNVPGEQGTITAGNPTKDMIYNFPLSPVGNLTDSPDYTTLTSSWSGMDTAPVVTEFSINKNDVDDEGISAYSTTVKQPDGTYSKQYLYNTNDFKSGMVFKDKTYYVNQGSEVVLASSKVQWAEGEYNTPRPVKMWATDERGQTMRTEYDYTGGKFNQVTSSCLYGYDGTNQVRCEKTEYENNTNYIGSRTLTTNSDNHEGNHVFNLIKAQEVWQNENRVARLEYEYDNNFNVNSNNHNLTNAPGVLNHNIAYNPYNTQAPNYNPTTNFRGNVTKQTSYANVNNFTANEPISQSMIYDIAGNTVTTQTNCCEQASYQFSTATQYAYPEAKTRGSADTNSPHRITTIATYDLNTGLLLSSTDDNGLIFSTEYNSQTLRPIRINLPTGAYVLRNFDGSAMTETHEVHEAPGIGTTIGQTANKSIKYFNGLGVINRESSAGAGGNWEDEVLTQYDEMGRVKKQSRPYRIGVENPQWTETFYDKLNRVTKVIAPDGSVSEAFYNDFNTLGRPDSALAGAKGQTVRSRDPWGREKWMRYDELEHLVEMVEPNPNGSGSVYESGSLVTRYNYDALNNLTETQQWDETRQSPQYRKFKYDSLGKLLRQKLAEQSATINDNGEYKGVSDSTSVWSEAYFYDDRANLIKKVDARGVITHYDYLTNGTTGTNDPLKRLSAIRYDLSGPRDTSVPIHAVSNTVFEYETESGKDKTRIKKVTSENSTEEFSYDSQNLIKDYILTINSRPDKPMTTSYLYDSLNRISETRYPEQYNLADSSRKVVKTYYDATSRLSKLEYNSQQHAGNFVYNAEGDTASLKIGTGTNQLTEEYSFDPQTGLVTNQKVKKSNNTLLLDLSYEYRRNVNGSFAAGRAGQITEITNNLDRNLDRVFNYDALGRLTKTSGGINKTWAQNYSYDRYGNRTSVTSSGTEALRANSSETGDNKDRNTLLREVENTPALANNEVLTSNLQRLANINNLDKNTVKTPSSNQESSADGSKQSANLAGLNKPFDFDNDGKADLSIWQKSTGSWIVNRSASSQNTTNLGISGDQIAPGDYDNDGKTDHAVWRPSTGDWHILRSSTASVSVVHWGAKGDSIMPADYDGDGKTDVAIWRPSTGEWYILRSSDGGYSSAQFGSQQFGDIPVAADYDGDGKADIAVWRPSTGEWFIMQSSNGQTINPVFGMKGDVPVQAKYDLDGKDDLAVWRPSTGEWFIMQSSNAQMVSTTFGGLQFGDIPVPADYDGDNKTDVAVWRQPSGTWYIFGSSDLQVTISTLGVSGNIAVPSAYRRRSSAPTNQNQEIPRDGLATVTYEAASNRITNSGFQYDVKGNLIKGLEPKGQRYFRYEYDAANRLRLVINDADNQVLQKVYYGSSNQRIAIEEPATGAVTFYAWASGMSVAEYSTTNWNAPNNPVTWLKSYVYLGGTLLSTISKGTLNTEEVEHHHPDMRGTKLVSNPQNGTVAAQATLPFGTVLTSENQVVTNKTFTSYDRNSQTGLDYAVNRTYDSVQGRFTQVDPAAMQAVELTNPQTLNLYTYCGNDPINHVDSQGLFFGKLFKWIGKSLFRLFKRIVHAAIRAVFQATITFITSGGNFGAAAAVFVAAFITNLAFPNSSNWMTPSWNPEARHPLIKTSSEDLWKYVIKNFGNDDDKLIYTWIHFINPFFDACGGSNYSNLTKQNATYALAAAGNDVGLANRISAIWMWETSMQLRPGGDAGPMQLTGWWRRHKPKLIYGNAYGTWKGRRDGVPFDGDPFDNLVTGANIINDGMARFNNNFYKVAEKYGPQSKEMPGDKYAKIIMGNFNALQPFWECIFQKTQR